MRKRTALVAALLCLLVVFYPQILAWAGEAGKEQATRISLWDTMKAGGIIGIIIILLSVGTLALAVEHFVTIRRDVLIPPEVMHELEGMLEQEQYEEALNVSAEDTSFLGQVVHAGLLEVSEGGNYQQMVDAMQEQGEEQSLKLAQKLEYTSLIGSIAPMLGLLGTVVGMIQAFNKIAQTRGLAKPDQLAEGISKALVTTCEGLIVAIPAMCIFSFFQKRVINLSVEVAQAADLLLRRFKAKK